MELGKSLHSGRSSIKGWPRFICGPAKGGEFPPPVYESQLLLVLVVQYKFKRRLSAGHVLLAELLTTLKGHHTKCRKASSFIPGKKKEGTPSAIFFCPRWVKSRHNVWTLFWVFFFSPHLDNIKDDQRCSRLLVYFPIVELPFLWSIFSIKGPSDYLEGYFKELS